MKTYIAESMTTNLVTIGWGETMNNAYRQMQESKIRHLPVLNDAGEVVGILSDRDVNRAMQSTLNADHKRMLVEEIRFSPEARVKDYMSWPIKSLDKSQSLKEAAWQMLREKISCFLVRDGESVIGIITTDDMLRALIELMEEPRPGFAWNLDRLLQRAKREAFA